MDPYAHPEDRKVRVRIQASEYTCEGLVHLPGIRLSDVMNEKNQFLVVVKAVLLRRRTGSEEPRPIELETLFINKDDIKFLVPLEETRISQL